MFISHTHETLSHYSIWTLLYICINRYTPLKRIEGMPAPLAYDPIKCNGCSSILNPFVYVWHLSAQSEKPMCVSLECCALFGRKSAPVPHFLIFVPLDKLILDRNCGLVHFVWQEIHFLHTMQRIFRRLIYQLSWFHRFVGAPQIYFSIFLITLINFYTLSASLKINVVIMIRLLLMWSHIYQLMESGCISRMLLHFYT